METEVSLPCSQQPLLVPTLSHMNPIHNFPPTSLRSILILSYHLRLGLARDLFPSGLPAKVLYAFLMSPMR